MGMTSQAVVSKAKWLLMSKHHDSKKAGHTGTLDPMATGLLPICFGVATRFAGFGLDAQKGYRAHLLLGIQTDTADKEGQVIATQAVPDFDDDTLQQIAQAFIGEQSQIPPMYSALKKDGKKLYEYARAGIDIERPPRTIVIDKLTLTKLKLNMIQLEVVCSKGTYVRTLGEDIAKRLGTVGCLVALRRTQTGGFFVGQATTLSALEELDLTQRLSLLQPTQTLIGDLPMLVVTHEEGKRLALGQRLMKPCDTTGLVQMVCDGVFLGLGELDKTGRLQPKKMLLQS